MKAVVIKKLGTIGKSSDLLQLVDMPKPTPESGEILIEVTACGVCHTELDEIEGRTPPPELPVVPGHQVVGKVVELGDDTSIFSKGDRVGVAWINSICGNCKYCKNNLENLCDKFKATGRDADGGYAEYMKIDEKFAFPIPDNLDDLHTAPLLCAGAIGYRSLKHCGLEDGENIGLTGFGASGHIVIQIVRHFYPNSNVFVFARNLDERQFAEQLGAVWSGGIEEHSPEKLKSIIDTTPVWKPVVEALKNLESGGRLIINAIRKEDVDKDYLLNINYQSHLWNEKEVKSVANLTRKDVLDFLKLASEIDLKPEVQQFRLDQAEDALLELKGGRIKGAKVINLKLLSD